MEPSSRSGPVAGDFIHFVAFHPCEGDPGAAVFEVERRFHVAEGDLTTAVGADDDGGRPAEIEIGAIPTSTIRQRPTSWQSAGELHQLGQARQIVSGDRQGEGQAHPIAAF
jgi:hypothetical protein